MCKKDCKNVRCRTKSIGSTDRSTSQHKCNVCVIKKHYKMNNYASAPRQISKNYTNIKINEGNKIRIKLGDMFVTALLDSGASISCISDSTCNTLIQQDSSLTKTCIHTKTCILANGTEININTSIRLPLSLANNTIRLTFYVLPVCHLHVIMGCDLLNFLRANINYNTNELTLYTPNDESHNDNSHNVTIGHIQYISPTDTSQPSHTHTSQYGTEILKHINLKDSQLNHDQNKQLKSLIVEYSDVFADNIYNIGKTHLYEYEIKINPGVKPIRLRPYKTAWKEREIISEQVQEWLDAKIIVPSYSEWAFPCLLTKKKNSTKLRLCVDYRKLNSVCPLQSYPTLDFQLFLADLGSRRCKYFTVLDLRSAFLQLPLSRESSDMTTFVCHRGSFRFLRCPFGLSNVPLAFSRLMDMVFEGIKNRFVHYYLDDIIISSETYEEHISHIKEVFERLRHSQLTLQPSKASFFQHQVVFLSHKIDRFGLSTDASNIDKVKQFPPPNRVRDIRSFLGLCNYYRRFILNYAKIAKPLQDLVRKDVKFQWNDDAKKAFEELKIKLTTAPVLALPDLNSDQPLRLTTDASSLATGFILTQKLYDDVTGKLQEKVICYGGRSLTDVQSKYSITELELFACLHAITKLDCYLRGRKFVLITDHAALKWLFKKDLNNVKPRLARWIVALQMYNFDVEHIAGKNIPHVDFLSRIDHRNPEEEITFKNEPYLNAVQEKTFSKDIRDRMTGDNTRHITMTDIKSEQKHCFSFKNMYNYLKYNTLPTQRQQALRIIDQHQDYIIINNTLYHIWRSKHSKMDDKQQLCIPPAYRTAIISAYHDEPTFGHFGHMKTLTKIQHRYFWEGMSADTLRYIQGCVTCAEANIGNTGKAPLKSLPIPEQPFQVVHVDILSIHTPSSGFKYIVLIVDAFSKYTIGRALRNKTGKAVTKALFEDLFLRVGFPRNFIIRSDNGLENISSHNKAVHRLLGIKRVLTTPISPQSNGQLERYNRTLLNLLRKYCHNDPSKWSQYLQYAIFAMNSSASDSSKFSPMALVHGIETRSALDLQLPTPDESLPNTQYEAHEHWRKKLYHMRELAREHLVTAKEEQKKLYDRNTKPIPYAVGEQVFLKEPPSVPYADPKLRKRYTGPWTITKILPPTNVMLKNADGVPKPRSVHVNKIKYFRPRGPQTPIGSSSSHGIPEKKLPRGEVSGKSRDDSAKTEPNITEDEDVDDPHDHSLTFDLLGKQNIIPPRSNTIMDNAPDDSYFDDSSDDETLEDDSQRPHRRTTITTTNQDDDHTPRPTTSNRDADVIHSDMSTSTDDMIIDHQASSSCHSPNPKDGPSATKDQTVDHEANSPVSSETIHGPTGNEYKPINKVFRKRTGPEGLEYYVSWKNHPKKYNSWVKEQDMLPEMADQMTQKRLPEAKPRLNVISNVQPTKIILNDDDRLSPRYKLDHPLMRKYTSDNAIDLFYAHTLEQLYYFNIYYVIDQLDTFRYCVSKYGPLGTQFHLHMGSFPEAVKAHILYRTIIQILQHSPTVSKKLTSTTYQFIAMRDTIIPMYTTILILIREHKRLEEGHSISIDCTDIHNPVCDIYSTQTAKEDTDYISFHIQSPLNRIPTALPDLVKCDLTPTMIQRYNELTTV